MMISRFSVLLGVALSVTTLRGGEDSGAWREDLPRPVFDENPGLVELYHTAWDIAHAHIENQPGVPVPRYMDEGHRSDWIWIWDTCFMVHYCKYAPWEFPGIDSLGNFYGILMPEGNFSLPKVLGNRWSWGPGGVSGEGLLLDFKVHIPENPPLFAWTEYRHALQTGDRARLERVYREQRYLQRWFETFENFDPANKTMPGATRPVRLKKVGDLGYRWSGGASGMDNTPRGREGAKDLRPNGLADCPPNSDLLWVDAYAQQALAALSIARIAELLDDQVEAERWKRVYDAKKVKINELYWDEQDGFYYDILAGDLSKCKVPTIASYWTLLAEIPDSKRRQRLIEKLRDARWFGGPVPTPSLARKDADFCPEGGYWRGGVWMPTSYMTVKALDRYGEFALARDISRKIVFSMYETWRRVEPHTIWECYSPTECKPSTYKVPGRVRDAFCGWSALGPISLFIEDVIGVKEADAFKNVLTCDFATTPKGRVGVKNYRFGKVTCSIIATAEEIEVTSNREFFLRVDGRQTTVRPGRNVIARQRDGVPLCSIRFVAEQTGTNVWDETLGLFRRHPGVADEVWFSTGCTYPTLDWHRRKAVEQSAAAVDLRKLGITPSLQVQVTLGHGIVKGSAEQWAGKTWTGFTGFQGGECEHSACPTDERFIDYICESTACYAAYKPAWVWIDDDFRPIGHGPEADWNYSGDPRYYGCWCERCVSLFSKREGEKFTRSTLADRMRNDKSLADRWDAFTFESLAHVAERMARRFHELSPESRFGLQHCPHVTSRQALIFKALHRATGNRGVGSRPGGGWYQDHSFYGQILKAYSEIRQKNTIGNLPEIELYTPEIETYPRVFTSRSGRSVVIEALAALTMGMDTLSIFFLDCRMGKGEPLDFYERRFVMPLAKAESVLRTFRRHTRNTTPSGLVSVKPFPNFTRFESDVPSAMQITTGIPIVMDPQTAVGSIDLSSISACSASSSKLLDDYARADALSGGRLAVLPAEPLQGWLMPRVTADGRLRTVTFVNTTLDRSWPTKLRLRGVGESVREAQWFDLDGDRATFPVLRQGDETLVVLPEVDPWNGGFFAFWEGGAES